MRILKQGETWIPQFTQVWEVERLAELVNQTKNQWVPFFAPHAPTLVLGFIHAEHYTIRLTQDGLASLKHRQIVSLGPIPSAIDS